jgi:NADPH:quinone reductase-like Zn-dependent oxidoreductase
MKAFQFVEWQKPAELREVPVPEPGPGQVRIKVGGAGACHSDLHILEAPAGTKVFKLPFTLGHENAGWVEKLGSGAIGFAVGDQSSSMVSGAAAAARTAGLEWRTTVKTLGRSDPAASDKMAGWPTTWSFHPRGFSSRWARLTRVKLLRSPMLRSPVITP